MVLEVEVVSSNTTFYNSPNFNYNVPHVFLSCSERSVRILNKLFSINLNFWSN
jgi:hypothetical protein